MSINLNPQFGAITVSDVKPGNAIRAGGANTIYVVKELTGEPELIKRSEEVEYMKTSIGVKSHSVIRPAWMYVPHKADQYTKQDDGTYLKTKEDCGGIQMTEGDTNPHADVVQVEIDGDRLTVVG